MNPVQCMIDAPYNYITRDDSGWVISAKGENFLRTCSNNDEGTYRKLRDCFCCTSPVAISSYSDAKIR